MLAHQDLAKLLQQGKIVVAKTLGDSQIQSSSLDLRLGAKAFRLRASFLPGSRKVEDCLSTFSYQEVDLSQGAVLEKGCIYLVPLLESLALPKEYYGQANPKSTSGRLDIFTRLTVDFASRYDTIPSGYCGPLFAEISPRSFSVFIRAGCSLNQLRIFDGRQQSPIIAEQVLRLDLSGELGNIVGYRAQKHTGVIDYDKINFYEIEDFFEPIYFRQKILVLDPGEFYIFASYESVEVGEDQAAEMVPIDPAMGEFRVHYAGFFDPGFGKGIASRAIMEVRARDVPFIVENKQIFARLLFQRLNAPTSLLYGKYSNYQGQGLRLAKQFRQS